jgi:hypothetical protein
MAEGEKPPARHLQGWIDELYGGKKPVNVVERLIVESGRRQARSGSL